MNWGRFTAENAEIAERERERFGEKEERLSTLFPPSLSAISAFSAVKSSI